MIDLSAQTKRVDHLIQRILEDNSQPFLTLDRVTSDFEGVTRTIENLLKNADQETIEVLYPVFLCLNDYELTAERAWGEHRLWEIRQNSFGTEGSIGIGLAARERSVLESYEDVLEQLQSEYMVLFYQEELPPIFGSKRLRLVSSKDIFNVLLTVAVAEYVDIFQLTINGLPHLKDRIWTLLQEQTGLGAEKIQQIFMRWFSLKSKD